MVKRIVEATVVFLFIGIFFSTPSFGQVAPDYGSSGKWSLQSNTIDGNSRHAVALLANLSEDAVYKVCRDKDLTLVKNARTQILQVFVSGTRLIDANSNWKNYGLDQGSCIVAKGNQFAVLYEFPLNFDGPASSIKDIDILSGTYELLHYSGSAKTPKSGAEKFLKLSDWALDTRPPQHSVKHETMLVSGVSGLYRVCFNEHNVMVSGVDTSAALINKDYSVDFHLLADGIKLKLTGKIVYYRGKETCSDISASNLTVDFGSFPGDLAILRQAGEVWVLDETFIP